MKKKKNKSPFLTEEEQRLQDKLDYDLEFPPKGKDVKCEIKPGKGWLEIIKEGTVKTKRGNLTLEELTNIIHEVFNKRNKRRTESDIPIGLLSESDKKSVQFVFGAMIRDMGDELYHLGNGIITGKEGWDDFNKSLKSNNELF